MFESRIKQFAATFVFGMATGGFFAVTVVREAVPLRDHVWMIGITLAAGFPIIVGLIWWYMLLVRHTVRALGSKGGQLISHILAFQLASTVIIVALLLSFFYAAVV